MKGLMVLMKLYLKNYKINFVILMLFSMSFFTFIAISYMDKKSDIEHIKEHNMIRIDNGYNQIIKDLEYSLFKSRIDFILYKHNTDEKLEALKNKNTEKLYELFLPHFENIQKYDKSFSIMQLISIDGKSIVRIHDKNNYGDDLTLTGKSIEYILEHKKAISFFEFGKHGLAYRHIEPVFHNNEFIGLFEMGINPTIVVRKIKEVFGSNVYFLINDKLKNSDSPKTISSHGFSLCSLCYNKQDLFINAIFPTININNYDIPNVSFQDETFMTIAHDIYSIDGSIIGKILVFENITALTAQLNNFLIKSLVIYFVTLIISNILFNRYLNRIFKILDNQTQLLYEAKEKLEVTLESSQIGIWDWDIVKNIVLWDRKCYEMLGFENNSFKVDYEKWQSLIHVQDREKAHRNVQSQLSKGDTFIIEFRYQTAHNTWIWIEGRGKVIKKDVDGNAIQMVGTHTNISHIKEYEQVLEKEVKMKTKELDSLNHTLESKIKEEVEKNREKDYLLQQQTRLAAIGEMMGNIAHQWRQPLSAITSSISGLKLKKEFGILEDSDIEEVNDSIINNAQFLSQTIDNFRNFFRKDQPKKKFYVMDAIKDTIGIVKASYDNYFINLEKNLDTSISYVGSENLLSQVILNILSNAKDALSQNTSEQKVVAIKLSQIDDFVEISIKDNAGGIPEDLQDKIFDPYFTTKHQSQGTGLGLYMSSQIIHNHFNGTLSVKNIEDANGKGACFYIKFPLNNS